MDYDIKFRKLGFIRKSSYKLTSFLNILLIVYLFLSFFEPYLNQIVGSFLKFYIIFLIFMFIICHLVMKEKIRTVSLIFIPWLLFKIISITWGQLSLFFSPDIVTSQIYNNILMVVLLFLFSSTSNLPFIKKHISGFLLGFSFLFGIIGLFFSQPLISDSGIETSRIVLTILGNQIDPNNLAVFYLFFIAFSLNSFLTYNRKFFSLSAFIINSFNLLLTGSRAGLLTWIALIVFSLIFIISQSKIKLSRKYKLIFISLITVIVIAIIIRFFATEQLIDRLINFSDYEGGSGRDILWTQAVNNFSLKPLFGWGLGGYEWGTSHNTYLTTLVDTGIIGFILFICPLLYLGLKAFNKKNLFSLSLLLILLITSFFIDAINKRYFWNIILIIILWIESTQNVTKVGITND